jgi:hypothetical protein
MAKEKLAQRLWEAKNGFINPEDGMVIDPKSFQANYKVIGRVINQDVTGRLTEEQIAQRATEMGGTFYAQGHIGYEFIVYAPREPATALV